MHLTPANAVFVIISFEGPDPYSQAGGLGVRMTSLAAALARRGFPVHFYFVGDPQLPGEEVRDGVTFYRWAQWISAHHPTGVYAGEQGKIAELENTLPSHLVEHIARPAIRDNRWVVVMAEEWHTAQVVTRVSDLLHHEGLRDRTLMLWNANHRMGLNMIDFQRLQYVATLTTVSRFMKHLMWRHGINPAVIPNGIDPFWLEPVDEADVERVRQHRSRPLLVKVGRFDPDKRWLMAVDSVAQLKREGLRPTLVIRGGIEPHGVEVFRSARAQGLTVADVVLPGTPSLEEAIGALERAPEADILNLRFFVPAELLRLLYRAADATLVNSGFEPFGLVGLEVMGSGGLPITGATGEDYAQAFVNSLVVESDDARELTALIRYLMANPERVTTMLAEGRRTAMTYQWDRVLDILLFQLDFMQRKQSGKG